MEEEVFNASVPIPNRVINTMLIREDPMRISKKIKPFSLLFKILFFLNIVSYFGFRASDLTLPIIANSNLM